MPRMVDQLRAVGFDLDGTLIDTAPDLCAAANAMLSALGGQELPNRQLRGMIGDGVERFIDRALLAGLGASRPDDSLRAAARAKFTSLYRVQLFERSRVYDGVSDALRSLREAGLALCCITNKRSEFALPLLQAARLDQLLDFTLCADQAGERKPSAIMPLAACARLAVKPQTLLFVGDSRIDVAAARAAGCRSAVVRYGYDDEVTMMEEDGPDAVIDDLLDILELAAP